MLTIDRAYFKLTGGWSFDFIHYMPSPVASLASARPRCFGSIRHCGTFIKTHRLYGDCPFWAMAPILFKFDCLVHPVFIKCHPPHFVRSLVFSAAETDRGAKAQVEVACVLQDVDELLGIELWSRTLKRLDQDVCRNIALERRVIRGLAGKIFSKGIFV